MRLNKTKSVKDETKNKGSLLELIKTELNNKLEAKTRIQHGDNVEKVGKELNIEFVQPL